MICQVRFAIHPNGSCMEREGEVLGEIAGRQMVEEFTTSLRKNNQEVNHSPNRGFTCHTNCYILAATRRVASS